MSLPRSYVTITDGAPTSASATLAIGSPGESGGKPATSTSIALSKERREQMILDAISRHCQRAQWAIHHMTVGTARNNPWDRWLTWWKERDAYLRSFLPEPGERKGRDRQAHAPRGAKTKNNIRG